MHELTGNNRIDEQIALLGGIIRGFDHKLLVAITSRDCGKYNGKYDEIGIRAQDKIGDELLKYFLDNWKFMNLNQFQAAVDALNFKSECTPYGFPLTYGYFVGEKFVEHLKQNETSVVEFAAKY